MTQLPRSLRIGPHRYKIIVDHNSLMEGHDAGWCNADRTTIALGARLSPSACADTLLHEIVHALLATVKLEEETEEAVCLALAPGLLGLLRDNPTLHPFLMAAK